MIEPRNYYSVKEVDTVVLVADNTVLIVLVRVTQLFRGLRTWRGRMINIFMRTTDILYALRNQYDNELGITREEIKRCTGSPISS